MVERKKMDDVDASMSVAEEQSRRERVIWCDGSRPQGTNKLAWDATQKWQSNNDQCYTASDKRMYLKKASLSSSQLMNTQWVLLHLSSSLWCCMHAQVPESMHAQVQQGQLWVDFPPKQTNKQSHKTSNCSTVCAGISLHIFHLFMRSVLVSESLEFLIQREGLAKFVKMQMKNVCRWCGVRWCYFVGIISCKHTYS